MAEYIDREVAVNLLTDSMDAYGTFSVERSIYMTARQKIKNLPASDVAKVVHGRWKKEVYVDPYGADWTRYRCSLCRRVEIRKEPYCNCGAKMDGEENDG